MKKLFMILALFFVAVTSFAEDSYKSSIIADDYTIYYIRENYYGFALSYKYYVVYRHGFSVYKIENNKLYKTIQAQIKGGETGDLFDLDNDTIYYCETSGNEDRITSKNIENPQELKPIYVSSRNSILKIDVSNGKIAYVAYDKNSQNYNIYLKTGHGTSLISTSKYVEGLSNYDGKLVWTEAEKYDNGSVNKSTKEILYFNGEYKTKLTNNSYEDANPFIYKNIIVWNFYDGNDMEIKYFDGENFFQLTDNNIDDIKPVVYNNKFAWGTETEDDFGLRGQIIYWDGKFKHYIHSTEQHIFDIKLVRGILGWRLFYEFSYYYYSPVDPWFDEPASQIFSSYDFAYLPKAGTTPENFKPIGLGDIYDNRLSLKVETPNFETPIDLYFVIYVPEISNEYYLLDGDGNLQAASKKIAKWKENITEKIDKLLFSLSTDNLPSGTYNFYLVAVKAGTFDLNKAYIWHTSFKNK